MQTGLSHRSFQVAAAAFVFLVGSAHGQTAAEISRENKVLADAKEAIYREDGSLRTFEPKALAGGRAYREGDSLVLRLGSGRVKSYQNKPECKDPDVIEQAKCEVYELLLHARALKLFVVGKLYYEWADYLLVDGSSGEETTLVALPLFSPTGKHAVVLIENDPELGFEVQVWRRAGTKFVKEWSGSPHTDGQYTSYKFIRWNIENTIELQSETQYSGASVVKKRFKLRQSTSGWQVVEAP